MAKNTTKKKVTVIRRKSNAGRIAEEKHVGMETVDWQNVKDFDAAFRDTMRHYGYFYDLKEGNKWATEWVKKNYTKAQLANFKAADVWKTSMTVCSLCKMLLNGAKFDKDRMEWLNAKISESIDQGKAKKKNIKQVQAVVTRKSPAEVVKEKTSDFIAEIENVLDDWSRGVWLDVDEYSVYNELQKIEAPYVMAKRVVEYYTPIRDEIEELVKKKTPELVEGYGNMTIKRRRELLKLLNRIVEDAEKYGAAKSATRKPRKKKAVSVSQMTAKVNYLKDSPDFKIASVDPSEIIGAKIVWLFNVKYRTMTRIESSNGLTIKGTTIYDFDDDKCVKKTIRKPEEFFASMAKTTKAKMDRQFKSLKTKEAVSTGRMSNDTIIYKVYK
jgi:hypothetical protein